MAKILLIIDDEEHMLRLLQFTHRLVTAFVATPNLGEGAIEFFQEIARGFNYPRLFDAWAEWGREASETTPASQRCQCATDYANLA